MSDIICAILASKWYIMAECHFADSFYGPSLTHVNFALFVFYSWLVPMN